MTIKAKAFKAYQNEIELIWLLRDNKEVTSTLIESLTQYIAYLDNHRRQLELTADSMFLKKVLNETKEKIQTCKDMSDKLKAINRHL